MLGVFALMLFLGQGPAASQPSPANRAAAGPSAAGPEDATPAPPSQATYGAAQAKADVDTVLTDTAMPYIVARARLVEHPGPAIEALLDRLEGIPAPGPAQRKRLLDVLAEIRSPAHVDLFAGELRRAVANAPDPAQAKVAFERFRPLLRDQGQAASGALQKLVGDRELPTAVRLALLDDLVAVTSTAKIQSLVVLIGRGERALRQQLRRALTRRTHTDPSVRPPLVQKTDAEIAKASQNSTDAQERSRLAALVQFRAAITDGADEAFTAQLQRLATDENAAFVARVAAVRGLGSRPEPSAAKTLAKVAADQLRGPSPRPQSAEILGAVALQSLNPEQARTIADELKLMADSSPRLAVIGYEVGTVPTDPAWLERSADNPWPQVRHAALSRVGTTCSRKLIDSVAKMAGPTDKGGDRDRAVARAAVQALGRCGPPDASKALVRLLNNDRADVEQRAEAARQLVRHGSAAGVDTVAETLAAGQDRALARRLATALRYAKAPTPRATQVLCDQRQVRGEVSRAANESLLRLHPGEPDPCIP